MAALLALTLTCTVSRAESVVATDSLPSKTLGRQFPYVVYLPDGYRQNAMRYPVLYLLHGAGGDEMAWARDGGIKATADRLIASGAIPPAIIVMPGCRTCWWVDGAVDKAETAFWNELVPAIDGRFRTIASRRGRLIAGLSAGGFGAVRFALRYPDRIAAAAALSPAVYAEAPPGQSSARTQPPFLKPDGSFDEASWKAKNYTGVIDAYWRQGNRVAFYLMSGDNDGYGIAFETMTLFKQLYGRQPELTELRIDDGDHNWSLWARSIENAMRYVFRHADRPVLIPTTDRAKLVTHQGAGPAIVASSPVTPDQNAVWYP